MHIIAHQQGKIFKKISSCCYKKKITGKLKKQKKTLTPKQQKQKTTTTN